MMARVINVASCELKLVAPVYSNSFKMSLFSVGSGVWAIAVAPGASNARRQTFSNARRNRIDISFQSVRRAVVVDISTAHVLLSKFEPRACHSTSPTRFPSAPHKPQPRWHGDRSVIERDSRRGRQFRTLAGASLGTPSPAGRMPPRAPPPHNY